MRSALRTGRPPSLKLRKMTSPINYRRSAQVQTRQRDRGFDGGRDGRTLRGWPEDQLGGGAPARGGDAHAGFGAETGLSFLCVRVCRSVCPEPVLANHRPCS